MCVEIRSWLTTREKFCESISKTSVPKAISLNPFPLEAR